MSLFAVKNDKGEWLGWEVYQDDPEFICGGGSVWTDLDKAKFYAKANGGHVVELAEAPAKVVVSEDEAKMLKRAKDTAVWRPAAVISEYAYNAAKDSDQEALLEARLMRAYMIGWTVEKQKRYVLPMEGTEDDETQAYASYLAEAGVWDVQRNCPVPPRNGARCQVEFTHADIDAAPDWVKAITPVEVTNDEQ